MSTKCMYKVGCQVCIDFEKKIIVFINIISMEMQGCIRVV